ncbi:DegT/DnrJ/EryC1/StrS family aminotransferase [Vibrio coralliilyticus]|uniref:DegT/DnrJ/EryC1/StrS family aminotransferase n=1 Tax=Vibrio TaxID=662 RepID=UPI0005033759|nr:MULTISPECIES: DegT/DnrJ/EryC1/StrS family aminotransferase [Vibrio]KFI10398.1 aminotransferase DegT [Vibrio sp. B183]NOI16705.1 DegT/DnrJ/EryC1/StrS family aminotransferase [Vibrio coralliilyticus]
MNEQHTTTFPKWPAFHPDSLRDVIEPLKSGEVNYWTGNKGREFEDAFAKWCGSDFAISCSSGTSALHTIISAMDIGPGDEIIVPSYSFIASSYAVLQAGAIPIFCDVSADHTINPDKIEALVTKRTRAIIVVHLYGVVCDMQPIMEIAERYQIKVIEDAAQCIGGQYYNQKVGTLGHAAAFSFCQSKHFTTGGEGGMITTNDENLAWECRSFRDHGFDVKHKLALLEMEEKEKYIHHRVGYNYRMTEIQSIIGLNELKRFDDWNLLNRRKNAFIYRECLSQCQYIESLPLDTPDRQNAYWLFPIVFDQSFDEQRTESVYKKLVEKGIPVTKVLWPEAYREKAYTDLIGFGKANFPFHSSEYTDPQSVKYDNQICPMAYSLSKRTLNLHLHPTWNAEHIEKCASTLLDVLAEIHGGNHG